MYVHVANDLCRGLFESCAAVGERTLENGHDEGERRGVDDVDERRFEQHAEALLRVFVRVVKRRQNCGHQHLDWVTSVGKRRSKSV